MRANLALIVKRLSRIIPLLLLGMIPAAAQTQTRSIEWQPHPFYSKDDAGRPISNVLEIVEFKVEDKVITLGEPFAASDEWLKNLKVRVRNISGKTITRAQMNFVLPESKTETERMLPIWLAYGNIPSDNPKPIKPGEEFEFAINEWSYHDFAGRIAARKNPAIINKLWITVATTHFADGTIWGSGCIKATNPKDACPL
jgi:hypothetical protein